jgi:hypothetical protein
MQSRRLAEQNRHRKINRKIVEQRVANLKMMLGSCLPHHRCRTPLSLA